MATPKVLVVGGAGKFAGLVVPALVRRGAHVRALVRDEAAAVRAGTNGAAESAIGNLRDVDSLRRAADGVDGVFHIGPAFLPDEAQLGLNMVEAARRAGVRKFVFSSVMQPTHTGLANHLSKVPVETALFESGLRYVILQPANLMQNLAAAWPAVLKHGVFAEPFPVSARVARVDYRDVAEVAAIALTEDRLDYGSFELAAEMIDRNRVVAIMSKLLGRTITAAAPSFDQWSSAAQLPYDATQLSLLAKVFAHYGAHGLGGNSLALRTILGREPRMLEDYLRDLAASTA